MRFCLGGRMLGGANNATSRNQDCSINFPDNRVGDDYQSGNGFFPSSDADIACRVLTRIVHVGWLREITFEPRWAPFPEAGAQFLLADLSAGKAARTRYHRIDGKRGKQD